ncbi:MAG: hypothetical protein DRQ55_16590 [Planctomycetota bacterium]|nr:MAG: hypothetical protein DRQ55_16590 [Planctomycetota bacterium]
MSSMRWIYRIAAGAALLGFVLGAAYAAYELHNTAFVREFQSGEQSAAAERWIAIAHRGAIDGVGFGALGLLLSLVAVAMARLRVRADQQRFGAELAASVILATVAFCGWVSVAQLADDALPFLQAPALLLLNVVGVLGSLVCFVGFDAIVRRLPGAAPTGPAAVALASTGAAWLACHYSFSIIKGVSGGFRSPARLGMAAGCFVLALVAAVVLARLLNAPLRALAERCARGRLVPRALTAVVGGLLLLAMAVTGANFEMSASSDVVEYATLRVKGEPASGPRVVWITIDTLRADHLGSYGYQRPTSPTLDAIAAEGTLFTDPTAPASWTKPSTGTILTGLHPSRHGALYHGSQLQLPEGERTLAEAFREAGYATAGFVSNPNIKKVFGFDRGFDEYFDSPVEDTVTLASIRGSHFGQVLMKLMRHQFNWKYENDVHQMNAHILAWLDRNRDVPFFLYLHYIDPHLPYSPPEPYLRQFAQDHGAVTFNRREELVGIDLYDGEIRYLDDGIKELVQHLKALELWDDTLVVVTSDHGEEFFEHGVTGHGFSLYQGVMAVPVFLRGPGVARGRRVDAPVQVLDLPATVLDLAGTGVTQLGDGASFAQAARLGGWTSDGPLYMESEFGTDDSNHRSFVFSGVRQGQWKLVLTEENAYFPPATYGAQALFNLDEDPEEQVNLIEREEHRELVSELLEGLSSHATFLQGAGFRDVEPASMDPEVLQQLQALGYMGG